MAKSHIPWWFRSSPVIRRLSTAASSAVVGAPAVREMAESKSLYQLLSTLGGAAETLDKWSMEGKRMTAPQLMKHVRALRKFGRQKQALEVMDWMERKGMEMPKSCYALRLHLISEVKGVNSAEQYFLSLAEAAKNQRTYGALLNCYCSKKMMDKAIALHEKMKELNLASNTLTYNHLMGLYMRVSQPEKVPSLVQEMKASNVFPDNCTYRILIKSYASMNDIGSVERAIQDMEGSEVPLDWSTYCQLADIYNSAGLFEKANISLKKAELVMNSHDLSPFPLLISLYARTGNLAAVKQVWKLLKARTARPGNKHYLAMLQALGKLDDMDALKHCFREWESRCDNYDVRLVNVVIGAYLRKDMAKEARLLQEKAEEKSAWSDLQTLELFIDYYLKHRELNVVQKFSRTATCTVKGGRLRALETNDTCSELLEEL